jgi:hypothetical protein
MHARVRRRNELARRGAAHLAVLVGHDVGPLELGLAAARAAADGFEHGVRDMKECKEHREYSSGVDGMWNGACVTCGLELLTSTTLAALTTTTTTT